MTACGVPGALGVWNLEPIRPGRKKRTADAFPFEHSAGTWGNGAHIVKVRPAAFDFLSGGNAVGDFVILDGEPIVACRPRTQAHRFFPGGGSPIA